MNLVISYPMPNPEIIYIPITLNGLIRLYLYTYAQVCNNNNEKEVMNLSGSEGGHGRDLREEKGAMM